MGCPCQNGGEKAKPLVIPTPDSPVWASELKTEGKIDEKGSLRDYRADRHCRHGSC
jgi:hypothetical protein